MAARTHDAMRATTLTHIGTSKPLTTTDQPPIRRSRCTRPNTARIVAAMDVNGFMMSRSGNGAEMSGSHVTAVGTGILGIRGSDECGGKNCAENQATRFHDCTLLVPAIYVFFRRNAPH